MIKHRYYYFAEHGRIKTIKKSNETLTRISKYIHEVIETYKNIGINVHTFSMKGTRRQLTWISNESNKNNSQLIAKEMLKMKPESFIPVNFSLDNAGIMS